MSAIEALIGIVFLLMQKVECWYLLRILWKDQWCNAFADQCIRLY